MVGARNPGPAAIAVALAATLLGCTAPPSAAEAVGQAPGRTLDAHTARMRWRVGSGLAQYQALGAYDFGTNRGTARVGLEGKAPPAKPEPKSPDDRATGSPGDVVLAGGTAYQRLGLLLTGGYLGGAPWLSYSTGAPEAPLFDPRTVIHLVAALSAVRKVGQADVAGGRYSGQLEIARALAITHEDPKEIERIPKALRSRNLTVDVWLDRAGRIAQVRTAPPRGARSLVLDLSLELYDFGVDVPVTLPPPEEVADADTLTPERSG